MCLGLRCHSRIQMRASCRNKLASELQFTPVRSLLPRRESDGIAAGRQDWIAAVNPLQGDTVNVKYNFSYLLQTDFGIGVSLTDSLCLRPVSGKAAEAQGVPVMAPRGGLGPSPRTVG